MACLIKQLILDCLPVLVSFFALGLSLYIHFFDKKKWNLELITSIVKNFSEAPALVEIFHQLENGNFHYRKETPDPSPNEEDEKEEETPAYEKQKIYALIRLFAIPAIAYDKKLIKLKDAFPLEYYIRIIGENRNVRKLLADYQKELRIKNKDKHPFILFCKMADDFMENSSL